jgi:hypothetical protein
MSMRTRALSVLVPAVMVAIATLQLSLSQAQSLTPWKGGGFGMFSTVDSRDARFLRVYAITADGELPVRMPRPMAALASEARSLPTRARFETLARQLAATEWVAGDDQTRTRLRARAKADAGLASIGVHAIRVEYWHYEFDAPARRLRAARLEQVTVAKGASHAR